MRCRHPWAPGTRIGFTCTDVLPVARRFWPNAPTPGVPKWDNASKGDQSGLRHSAYTHRPFTLEGNFAAMQVVQEMLLQSWSPTPGTPESEVLRIFPAVPAQRAGASFTELRAAGGFGVAVGRQGNVTTSLTVVAGRDGTVRIRNNVDGREPSWSVGGVVKIGHDFHLAMLRGDVATA